MTRPAICECPIEMIYSASEICDYCVEVAFFDDPDYAEMMGFVLVGDEWRGPRRGRRARSSATVE